MVLASELGGNRAPSRRCIMKRNNAHHSMGSKRLCPFVSHAKDLRNASTIGWWRIADKKSPAAHRGRQPGNYRYPSIKPAKRHGTLGRMKRIRHLSPANHGAGSNIELKIIYDQ